VTILRSHSAKLLLLCLLFCSLLSCSSATPATRYYLLSKPNQLAATDTACSVQVGTTTVAPYLQRTHIMLQNGTNELLPAVQHRWSEPLEAGVRRLLARCLGGSAPTNRKANVQIEHLHGNTNGTVVIEARWALLSSENRSENSSAPGAISALVERQFTASMPQPVAGYDALVSTQRALVLQLCADIKSAVPDC